MCRKRATIHVLYFFNKIMNSAIHYLLTLLSQSLGVYYVFCRSTIPRDRTSYWGTTWLNMWTAWSLPQMFWNFSIIHIQIKIQIMGYLFLFNKLTPTMVFATISHDIFFTVLFEQFILLMVILNQWELYCWLFLYGISSPTSSWYFIPFVIFLRLLKVPINR